MNKIEVRECQPEVFYLEGDFNSESQIWGSMTSFERGRRYLVKADSGRGKSSLCNFLMGKRADFRGEILFDGRSVKEFTEGEWQGVRSSKLAYLPQGLMLFDELTAMENIVLKNQLSSSYRFHEWIEESLEFLEIGNRANYLVSKLSYGQKQRVALVRALCQEFDFLILDEPISHLDFNTADLMAKLVDRELRSSGAGLISTSIGKELPVEYDKVLVL